MIRMYHSISSLAVLLAAAFVSTVASAVYIPLGTISSPTSIAVDQSGLLGPFEHPYAFNIGAGDSFTFSSSLSTGFSSLTGISSFIGQLYGNGGVFLASGTSQTRTTPEGFAAYDIRFDPMLLGAGQYTLLIRGSAFAAFPGPTASYSGSLSFTSTAAVIDEPSPAMLLAAAGLALGLVRKRPRHDVPTRPAQPA